MNPCQREVAVSRVERTEFEQGYPGLYLGIRHVGRMRKTGSVGNVVGGDGLTGGHEKSLDKTTW